MNYKAHSVTCFWERFRLSIDRQRPFMIASTVAILDINNDQHRLKTYGYC